MLEDNEQNFVMPETLYEELKKSVLELNPTADMGRIRAAYECALLAHSGQKRKDSSEYVTHTIAAAQICVELGLDEDSIVAALLHDCIEDTPLTYADIAKQFGNAVAALHR